MTIQFSRNQVKSADRMGGIEMLFPWPAELGEPGELDPDTERDASPEEHAWVARHVRPAAHAVGLVAGRTKVACVHGPIPGSRAAGWHIRIAVALVGERWVGLGRSNHSTMYYMGPMP